MKFDLENLSETENILLRWNSHLAYRLQGSESLPTAILMKLPRKALHGKVLHMTEI